MKLWVRSTEDIDIVRKEMLNVYLHFTDYHAKLVNHVNSAECIRHRGLRLLITEKIGELVLWLNYLHLMINPYCGEFLPKLLEQSSVSINEHVMLEDESDDSDSNRRTASYPWIMMTRMIKMKTAISYVMRLMTLYCKLHYAHSQVVTTIF